MTIISPTLPSAGDPRGSEEVDVRNALATLLTDYNGAITVDNLATALQQALGITGGGVTRRGKSIIATEEPRTNTAYGLMTTPDRVQNIVMPTDGFIRVAYSALWKTSAGTGKAAIFLGSNQLTTRTGAHAAPQVEEAAHAVNGTYAALVTTPVGLMTVQTTAEHTSDVTTGQVIGGLTNAAGASQGQITSPSGLSWPIPGVASANAATGGECVIFAAAGTYDVTVQFKTTSGSVTAKERKLWVTAESFG